MGEAAIQVCVQKQDFDIGAEIATLSRNDKNIGAIVSFSGLCRDEDGTLNALELEHYPGMAEEEITRIAKSACEKWPLRALHVIHRYGNIKPGENIVLVLAASRHRQAAFDGANYLMDFLKTNAPFWKKEHLVSSDEAQWVSAKDDDETALNKWTDSI